MKIGVYKCKDPMEADFGINLRFFKEKDDKDFYLRMYRLLNKERLDIIGWILFNLSSGNEISAERFEPEEFKLLEGKAEEFFKNKRKNNKILSLSGIIIGLILVVSPILNMPNYPALWFTILGYITVLLSSVSYALADNIDVNRGR